MSSTEVSSSVQVPAWAKDAIFYQIFPDRFARSAELRKPTNLREWHEPPTQEGYHGGDLLGIVEHLDYLVDLGINALYLTPIFQSGSNHRYHTQDYEKVDPLLGGNAALRKLVTECHRRELRIILDGVFNHASRGFLPFHDILENGPHSPWLDWFFIQGWPLAAYEGHLPANYVSWVGNRALPKFNTDNPQVREYIMGIAEYWIREFDIDGWRLDVPAEISTPGFWEEFRERVLAARPDAYIIGGIWREAPEWLRGDRFHSTMNYLFTAATIAFTAGDRVSEPLVRHRSYDPYPGIDATVYRQRIERLLSLYDWETTQVQFNLLDSHDTARLLSIARDDKATVRLATLLQMTYPGTPSIYYGDEIALRGTDAFDELHRDCDARWPFPWHDERLWDGQMLDYFKRVIALRKRFSVLRNGRYRSLLARDDRYVFARGDEREALLVAVNVGDRAEHLDIPSQGCWQDGAVLKSLLGAEREVSVHGGRIDMRLAPRSGEIFASRPLCSW